MRRLLPLAILAASIAVAGCSSGAATPTPASSAGLPAESAAASATAAPPSAAPSESAAVASSAPSIDASAFGSQYAKIQSDLQAEIAKITAGMMTATTPAQLTAVYKQFADAMRKSITASRAISWPAAIGGDMDKLLADEEELVNLWEQMMNDPTASANQDRIAAIEAEMPALAQKIAAYFGVSVP